MLFAGEEPTERCVGAWHSYLVCLHVALGSTYKFPTSSFVTRGPGEPVWRDGDNAMFTAEEHATFATVQLIGAFLGMYLSSAFVAVVASRDGSTVAEQVTIFCKKYKVSKADRRQLQNYFLSLAQLSGTVPKGDLFFKLSPRLADNMLIKVRACLCSRCLPTSPPPPTLGQTATQFI